MNIKSIISFLSTAIFIFSCSFTSAQSWIPLGEGIDGGGLRSHFGTSVSINDDGTNVIVGAPQHSAGGEPGYASVYQWMDNTWIAKGNVITGENANDGFGESVSISADGNTIAIGAINNDANGSSSGQVYIYEWNDSEWALKGTPISGENAQDQSGGAIQLSDDGNVIIIGAIGNDETGPFAGHARVFEWVDNAWVQKGSDLESGFGEFFGSAVSISSDGNTIAVSGNGAPNNTRKGVTRIYTYTDSDWEQLGDDIFGDNEDDILGNAIQLDDEGGIIVLGAPFTKGPLNDTKGKVKIFQWSGLAWIQMGETLVGDSGGDSFGAALSINSAGDRIAVGALDDDNNGTNSGKLVVFEWNGTLWNPLGDDLTGNTSGDNQGAAVFISGDGLTIISSATGYDGDESNEGIAYVYQYQGPSNIATLSDLQVDATTIPDFDSNVSDYTYGIAGGTIDLPQITSAITTDPNATISITQVSAIPGVATVEVTAEDGTTRQTYTVSFFFNSPADGAPTPIDLEPNVICLFSDAYPDVSVDTWNTVWSDATFEDVMIDGNPTKKYTNLGFNGIETVASPLDVSDMMYFNMNVWSPNMTEIKIKLVDFLGDGFAGPNGDTEAELTFPIVQGEWMTLQILLEDFANAGMTSFADMNQYIISSVPFGTGTLFVDNIYFSKIVSSTQNIEIPKHITVYPNPLNSNGTLYLSENAKRIEVMTLQGQLLKSAEGTRIDLDDITQGIFIVRITSKEGARQLTKIVLR